MNALPSAIEGRLSWIDGGGLLSVPGWRGAVMNTGVKQSGQLDLAILSCDEPRPAAGVFTRCELPAAPVVIGRESLHEEPLVRTIAINAGNANAMTGERGISDARIMRDRVAEQFGGPALVLSTGIIGVPLPLNRILCGIDAAAGTLRAECDEIADAIMTTDTTRKACAVRVDLPEHSGRAASTLIVGGLAKGSGMIHPNMATMLSVVAFDQPMESSTLRGVLKRAVDRSFHEITVDGDTSTNDTVLLVAGHTSANAPIAEGDPWLPEIERAVGAVMERLARAIVEDGEGRTRIMEVLVEGAADEASARAVADSMARSSLVKTALTGGDPNWGRLLAAAGNAGVVLKPERATLEICDILVFEDGGPSDYNAHALGAAFSASEVRVRLNLGQGSGQARKLTSDLSVDYVRANSEYTT
ncbi:MAG: glutamate N-acetyltransferase/amino-acid N-acetyltransferase [Planctomycetota bacterium]|jgi:glutamate N-acetyltransferase/amino-acid N-acetyltransferase